MKPGLFYKQHGSKETESAMVLHHTLCNALLTKQLQPEIVTFLKGYRVLIPFEKTTTIQNAVALKKFISIIKKNIFILAHIQFIQQVP